MEVPVLLGEALCDQISLRLRVLIEIHAFIPVRHVIKIHDRLGRREILHHGLLLNLLYNLGLRFDILSLLNYSHAILRLLYIALYGLNHVIELGAFILLREHI